MASYLKFDGKSAQTVRLALQSGPWTQTGSIVLTAFVRPLQIPTYTAPIIGLAGETANSILGIWLNGVGTPGYSFSMSALGETFTVPIPASITSVPASPTNDIVRPGRIYKLQAIAAIDGGGGGFRMAFAVDGQIVKRGSVAISELIDPTFYNSVIVRLGGDPYTATDRISAVSIYRRAHFDLIQTKMEFDRDITFDGAGNILTHDLDSDPWTDLTIDSSASSGILYTLNEGSGAPQDSSGAGRHITVSTGIDWAGTSADPTYPSAGTARYALDHIQGYSLRASDAPTITPQPVYGPAGPVGDYTAGTLSLAQKARWLFHDGHQTNGFTPTTQLTSSTDQPYEGLRSIKADGSSAINNDLVPAVFSETEAWLDYRFYDPGGTTSTRIQRMSLNETGGGLHHIGVTIGISGTEYSTRVAGDSTPNAASGVPISVGWHRFSIYWNSASPTNHTLRFYIDDVQVREFTGASSGVNMDKLTLRNRGVSGTNDHGYYGAIALGLKDSLASTIPDAFSGIVESSGSVVLPLFQPSDSVASFDSVTFTETGTTTKTFRWSYNGGADWVSMGTLNDANLQSIAPSGGGHDVLEITLAQSATNDDITSPVVSQIDFGYTVQTSAWTEGQGTASSWSEGQGAAASWSEGSATAATFTEGSATSATWTEGSASSATWTEGS